MRNGLYVMLNSSTGKAFKYDQLYLACFYIAGLLCRVFKLLYNYCLPYNYLIIIYNSPNKVCNHLFSKVLT